MKTYTDFLQYNMVTRSIGQGLHYYQSVCISGGKGGGGIDIWYNVLPDDFLKYNITQFRKVNHYFVVFSFRCHNTIVLIQLKWWIVNGNDSVVISLATLTCVCSNRQLSSNYIFTTLGYTNYLTHRAIISSSCSVCFNYLQYMHDKPTTIWLWE